MKDYEKFLQSPYEFCIIMDFYIGQLKAISDMAEKYRKKLIVHVDLIKGLSCDEYAVIYLCQNIKLEGVISTHSSVISMAKKRRKLAIQRIFLIDQQSLDKSYHFIENSRPDYVEVLPGLMPRIISEMKENMDIPIITGGLISTPDDILVVLKAGAVAVTASSRELWQVNDV
jgi:glycerol uptake operon antiterminator